jgi:hypothetical protein
MLPSPASERAQARPEGNEGGSFFSPLLARKEGRSNPAPKGAARFARSARKKLPDGMALRLRLRKECGSKCGQGINNLAHEEDRQLVGVPAHQLRVAEIGSAVVAQRSVVRAFFR